MKRILCLLALVALSGCRALHADREDYTKKEALLELREHYPKMRVREDYFTPPFGDPDRQIRYSEIAEVRVKPIVPIMFISPFTGFLFGPFWYQLWITTTEGEEIKIDPLIRPMLNVFFMGIYPNVLIHGQSAGYALDWLRQFGTEGSGKR